MPSNLENNQVSSRSHGGARKGSGRKTGAATTKTREIADQAVKDGVTPLEVMLRAMRALVDEADRNIAKQVAAGVENVDTPHMLLQDAAAIAKDAAPYVHPKLSAVEMNAKVVSKTLAEELSELNALGNAEGDSPMA